MSSRLFAPDGAPDGDAVFRAPRSFVAFLRLLEERRSGDRPPAREEEELTVPTPELPAESDCLPCPELPRDHA